MENLVDTGGITHYDNDHAKELKKILHRQRYIKALRLILFKKIIYNTLERENK